MDKRILAAIETRKKHYDMLDEYMNRVLDDMIKNGESVTVYRLAKRCQIARNTVYKHKSVFEKIKLHRNEKI